MINPISPSKIIAISWPLMVYWRFVAPRNTNGMDHSTAGATVQPCVCLSLCFHCVCHVLPCVLSVFLVCIFLLVFTPFIFHTLLPLYIRYIYAKVVSNCACAFTRRSRDTLLGPLVVALDSPFGMWYIKRKRETRSLRPDAKVSQFMHASRLRHFLTLIQSSGVHGNVDQLRCARWCATSGFRRHWRWSKNRRLQHPDSRTHKDRKLRSCKRSRESVLYEVT